MIRELVIQVEIEDNGYDGLQYGAGSSSRGSKSVKFDDRSVKIRKIAFTIAAMCYFYIGTLYS